MSSSPCSRRILLVVAISFAVWSAADGATAEQPHNIFPPLQLFTEVCIKAGYSLQELSRLADLHHALLESSEGMPMPDGSRSQKLVWQAQTEVGPIGIIGIAGVTAANAQTFTCSVTAPPSSVGFIQAWCERSFGEPASILDRRQHVAEIRWTRNIGDEKEEVILLTQTPDNTSSLLSLVRHGVIRKQLY